MSNTTKQCTTCKTIKDLSEFGKKTMGKDGHKRICKPCTYIATQNWRKTKNGIISNIYNHEKESSIKRGHTPPEYTQKELKEWVFSQKKFHTLYNEWVKSNYNKNLTPSVDRKEDLINYRMDNIQIMTFGENRAKPSRGQFQIGHGHRNSNRWNNL